MTTPDRVQRLRLRKWECLRHLRVLEQKLAANPHDVFAKREIERLQELLKELEQEEQRLLSGSPEATGGEKGEGSP